MLDPVFYRAGPGVSAYPADMPVTGLQTDNLLASRGNEPAVGLLLMVTYEFEPDNLKTVSEALDIAEDATINFFKFSSAQWNRYRYEVKTISSWGCGDAPEWAFAALHKGCSAEDEPFVPSLRRDYYFICLQDHRIIEAVLRDRNLELLPLLVYVFTHELVHIVRFSSFLQRFIVRPESREKEESVVHDTTHRILDKHKLFMPALGYVLNSYRDHRICADSTGEGVEGYNFEEVK
ncbi:MAG: hypothetical protein R6U13_00845 [Desulfatiglandaceae bacterium]